MVTTRRTQPLPELPGARLRCDRRRLDARQRHVDSTPGASLRVELFSSAACGSSGTGQGEAFLGATTVTAGAGATSFAATVGPTQAGRAITATATDLTTGDTSEFSSCVFAAAAAAAHRHRHRR